MTADAVIALTNEEVDYLTEQYGIPKSKITVVPVGVNTTLFTPYGPTLPRSTRPRIVAIGRLVERKGLPILIEALAQVARTDAELVIAGGPAPEAVNSSSEIRALRLQARSLGILNRIHFLGRIPHSQVPELLRSSDAFVCAPHYEPFGTAALEAGACGVPVVASAVGGLKEHVIDGLTGFLVPPGDSAAFATSLNTLLSTPNLRAELGAAGATNALRYAWPVLAERILSAYRSLLKPW